MRGFLKPVTSALFVVTFLFVTGVLANASDYSQQPDSIRGETRFLIDTYNAFMGSAGEVMGFQARLRCAAFNGRWTPQGFCLLPAKADLTCILMGGRWGYNDFYGREMCHFRGNNQPGDVDALRVLHPVTDTNIFEADTNRSPLQECDVLKRVYDECHAMRNGGGCTEREFTKLLSDHLEEQIECNKRIAVMRSMAFCRALGHTWYRVTLPGVIPGDGFCAANAAAPIPACVLDIDSATPFAPPCYVPEPDDPAAEWPPTQDRINTGNPPRECSVQLSVSPTSIGIGQYATWSWNGENATACNLTVNGQLEQNGGGAGSVSRQYNTVGQYVGQVTCTSGDAGANPCQAEAVLTVGNSSNGCTVSLTVNPAQLSTEGGQATWAWQADTDLIGCTLYVNGNQAAQGSGTGSYTETYPPGTYQGNVSCQKLYAGTMITCSASAVLTSDGDGGGGGGGGSSCNVTSVTTSYPAGQENFFADKDTIPITVEGSGLQSCTVTLPSKDGGDLTVDLNNLPNGAIMPVTKWSDLVAGVKEAAKQPNTPPVTAHVECNDDPNCAGDVDLRICPIKEDANGQPRQTVWVEESQRCMLLQSPFTLLRVTFVGDDGAKKGWISIFNLRGVQGAFKGFQYEDQSGGHDLVVGTIFDTGRIGFCLAQDSCSGKYCDAFFELEVKMPNGQIRYVRLGSHGSGETKDKAVMVGSITSQEIVNAINSSSSNFIYLNPLQVTKRIGDSAAEVFQECSY